MEAPLNRSPEESVLQKDFGVSLKSLKVYFACFAATANGSSQTVHSLLNVCANLLMIAPFNASSLLQ